MSAKHTRSGGELMLPASERKHAEYDPARLCEYCGNPIDRERQENALFIGRYPKYDSDVCAKRAASARWYQRRGKALRAAAKRLKAKRRRRRKKT